MSDYSTALATIWLVTATAVGAPTLILVPSPYGARTSASSVDAKPKVRATSAPGERRLRSLAGPVGVGEYAIDPCRIAYDDDLIHARREAADRPEIRPLAIDEVHDADCYLLRDSAAMADGISSRLPPIDIDDDPHGFGPDPWAPPTPSPVGKAPAPPAAGLLGLGVLALAGLRRRA